MANQIILHIAYNYPTKYSSTFLATLLATTNNLCIMNLKIICINVHNSPTFKSLTLFIPGRGVFPPPATKVAHVSDQDSTRYEFETKRN